MIENILSLHKKKLYIMYVVILLSFHYTKELKTNLLAVTAVGEAGV